VQEIGDVVEILTIYIVAIEGKNLIANV